MMAGFERRALPQGAARPWKDVRSMNEMHALRRASAQVGLAALACLCLAPWPARAADGAAAPAAAVADGAVVVATGPAGDVTHAQLEAAVEALVPGKERELFWSTKDSVLRFVRGLGAQHELAGLAARAGIEPADPAAKGLAREQALVKAYLDRQSQAVAPDDAALDRYALSEYRAQPQRFVVPAQVHVRHILLALDKEGDNADAVKAHAEKLLAELRAGADFATLAKAESADKGSAQRGGELPWFAHGQMAAEFEIAAFALKQPGALSEPVKTPFGYHIIELLGTRAERKLSFEEVLPTLRDQARDKLEQSERNRLWTAALDQVKVDDAALLNVMYRNAAASR